MTFTPDDSQLKALTTWYLKDNPLHLDARHPCIKLAGECGELLDLYAKNEYKPDFSWWKCKHCKAYYYHNEQSTRIDNWPKCDCQNYTPLVLDELGDISYYLRILAYQKSLTFEELCGEFNPRWYSDDMLELLANLSWYSSLLVLDYIRDKDFDISNLRICNGLFLVILHKLDCSLENLLELNYRKLNSEETNHGWRDATVKQQ